MRCLVVCYCLQDRCGTQLHSHTACGAVCWAWCVAPRSSSKQTPSRVPFFRQVVKGLYSKTAFFALAAVPVVILGLRWHARREAQKLANIPLRKLVEKADAQGRERNLILPLATDMIRVVYAGDAESDDRPVMVVHVRSPQGAKAHGATGKHAAAGRRDAFAAFNPLAVTELFGTHKVVLNKFPLMRNHVRVWDGVEVCGRVCVCVRVLMCVAFVTCNRSYPHIVHGCCDAGTPGRRAHP